MLAHVGEQRVTAAFRALMSMLKNTCGKHHAHCLQFLMLYITHRENLHAGSEPAVTKQPKPVQNATYKQQESKTSTTCSIAVSIGHVSRTSTRASHSSSQALGPMQGQICRRLTLRKTLRSAPPAAPVVRVIGVCRARGHRGGRHDRPYTRRQSWPGPRRWQRPQGRPRRWRTTCQHHSSLRQEHAK
jgi:hypothetical protein